MGLCCVGRRKKTWILKYGQNEEEGVKEGRRAKRQTQCWLHPSGRGGRGGGLCPQLRCQCGQAAGVQEASQEWVPASVLSKGVI